MALLRLIFCLFFYTSYGVVLSLAFVRQSNLGRRYFLYHGLGAGVLATAGGLLISIFTTQDALTYCFSGFLLSTIAYCLTACVRPKLSWVFFFAAASLGLWAMSLEIQTRPTASAIAFLWILTNALLSALMLGFSLMAMLLGHWYLVQPKLSIDELRRLSLALLTIIAARLVFSSLTLWPLLEGKTELEFYRYFFGGNPGLFITMRWLWGILGPVALSYLIWGTVKIRSTQSATGILYVAVLAALTGETLCQYLMIFHGIAN